MITLIVIAIILCIVLPIVFVLVQKAEHESKLQENDALAIEEKAVHVNGLPSTGRELCSIMVTKDKVLFKTERQEFEIPSTKLIGAIVGQETRDVQSVQTNTKSSPSLGKAVVGGALFGPAGAIIGGASGKSKSTSNVQVSTQIVKLYLTIDYTSDGVQKQITFESRPTSYFYEVQNAINSIATKENVGSIVL